MKHAIKLLVLAAITLVAVGCGDNPIGPGSYNSIALYVDNGADPECTAATDNMLRWMGNTVIYVRAADINNGNFRDTYAIVFPGGNNYPYATDISSAGKENIREFIRNGGGYLGICAGAHFAAERSTWRGSSVPGGMLGLFAGETVGPLNDIIPYPDFGMAKVNIVDHAHPITSSEPEYHWILYYWGPALNPDSGSNVSILARYDVNNLPAMVAFNYGSGRVFLTGPHPEFEEDSTRDGVALGDDLDDQGSEWELMRKAVDWIQGR